MQNKINNPTLALMVTGGLDSTFLMYEYAEKNPLLLSFNYGQSAWDIQKNLIQYHIKKTNNPNSLVELALPLFNYQKSPGLFEPGFVPQKEDLNDFSTLPHVDYHIEGRNALMICYALAYCAHHKIDQLLLGYEFEKNEWENIRSFKMISDDTSPLFVDTMNILALSGFSHSVRIRAPFYERRMDKEAIIRAFLTKGISLDKTYSCYFVPGPCGVCDNCMLKNEVLKKIQMEGNK